MRTIFIWILFLQVTTLNAQQTVLYQVDQTQRKALIYVPSSQSHPLPVVFVFHGHGGNATAVSGKIDFHNHYKEALVIYMEGIPGKKSKADPRGIQNGWQVQANTLMNRDISFFDTVWHDISSKYNVDYSRIYLVGHSNGARFVNLLWKQYDQIFAAICSASAQGGKNIIGASPTSIWMYMGKKDPILPLAQQLKSLPYVKENLGITDQGKVFGDKTYYIGQNGSELVVQITRLGHEFPTETIPDIVSFFKRNSKSK